MPLLDNLVLGLATALAPQSLLFCLAGVLLGTLVGVLPGVGPAATIAMLLPMTYSLAPTTSLIMLAGIYYGAQYGGSTTAILLNMPGETSSAVTTLDGYRMAQQGRAGPALAIAAIGSFVAGTIATVLVAAFAPALSSVATSFRSPEYFSLMVLGLVSSVALANGSLVKAIGMILLGIAFGLVGTDQFSGTTRFTLGSPDFADGIGFVAVAVGVFGVAEVLRSMDGAFGASVVQARVTGLMPGRADLRASTGPILRGTAIGSVLGILPGGGAALSSFVAYTVEKRLSRTPQRFGAGAIEGVAAPEAANNAGAQTSFIPMLTLGIPSNPIMALMIGAMMIQGIVPGPSIVTKQAPLFWGLVASMWVGNLMLLVLNLPLVGVWVRLLTVPYHLLAPAILIFATLGVYSVEQNPMDVYVMAAFGVLGFVLVRLDAEPAPFLLGFVLGPMLEDHFRRSMLLSRGDPGVFFTSPLSAAMLAVAAGLLLLVLLPGIGRKRDEVFSDPD